MPWMPVNSQDKGGTVAIGTVVAVGTIVMLVVGVPWIRSFLYSIPAGPGGRAGAALLAQAARSGPDLTRI